MAEFGVIHTSDYVIDEAVTTALARTRNHQIAVNTGRYILDSERIEKLALSWEGFNLAWRIRYHQGQIPKLHGLHISSAYGETRH